MRNKRVVNHSHAEYCSSKAKFVDVFGNIILDNNGNTVNRYKGLKGMIDAGEVKIYRDIRPETAFYYLVTYPSQREEFELFRQTGKTKTRDIMFHVYVDPPDIQN